MGRRIGLRLSQAPFTTLPSEVVAFMAKAVSQHARPVYTDGSFVGLPPSLTALTHTFGKAATAVYLPAVYDAEALALIIRTPVRAAIDAYYQELLGTSMSILLLEHTTVLAFSDCSSAICRPR